MDTNEIIDEIASINEEILLADGFEEALIGHVQIFSKTVALYDKDKCLEILMSRDGMAYEDAEEYFDFNVTGSYMGEYTPGFATLLRK